MRNCLIIGKHMWHEGIFSYHYAGNKLHGKYNWFYSTNLESVKELNPRYIFFIHYSNKVPEDIIDNYECVCFHMTDVPYGRGGSPLQNLILKGHKSTKLTALRMTEKFDEGPVYLKKDLSLEGRAQEIYSIQTEMSFSMIKEIIENDIQPIEQTGEPTIFKRRKPHQSNICENEFETLEKVYDFIRMLDAEGYPTAYIDFGNFRIKFNHAKSRYNKINCLAEITRKEK